jgi:pimeloyl-ACP methyl ester carboxylesterase
MERSLGIALVVALAACLACDARTPEPPAADAAAPLELDAGARRLDVRFPCGDASCAGWLYLRQGGARAPVVVMGHGFAGTRDVALPFFAERLAARGLAAFVLDYRHFGASGGGPRQLVDPWTQLEDWRGALAFVRAHESLDPARVALWGSSMGGGLALITAAEDGAVRAVVAQVPLVDSGVEGEATFFGAWWLVRLLSLAFADLAVAALGGDSLTLPAIAPAGGLARATATKSSPTRSSPSTTGTRRRTRRRSARPSCSWPRARIALRRSRQWSRSRAPHRTRGSR